MMPKPDVVQFMDKCLECRQAAWFLLDDYAFDFGRIYSTDGLKAFTRDGTCETCTNILADFAVMGRKGDFL